MPEEAGDITLLLQTWRAGSRAAESELFATVMPNLRRLAHHMMRRERKGHTLQATELVNQVYFRMVAARDRDWQNRQHFFAIAARAMRRYLIDYARARPHAELVALEGLQNLIPADHANLDLALSVDRLLEELAEQKPEWCTLVELKYFLGLNDEEAAEALGLKLRTTQRMWHEARQWLFERLQQAQNARHSAGR
jgi:RNA polymerase sigma factor (TIGR02999 family)